MDSVISIYKIVSISTPIHTTPVMDLFTNSSLSACSSLICLYVCLVFIIFLMKVLKIMSQKVSLCLQ